MVRRLPQVLGRDRYGEDKERAEGNWNGVPFLFFVARGAQRGCKKAVQRLRQTVESIYLPVCSGIH